jgi:cell division protein FtsB
VTRPARGSRSRTPSGRAATAPKAPGRTRTTAGAAATTVPGSVTSTADVVDVTDRSLRARGNASRNRFTGRAAVLLMVLVMLGVAYAWPLREYLSQRSELNDLRASTRLSQAKVDALQAEKERWADPAYVEAQARARLHYVMPGEVAFVVLHPNQPNLVQTLPKTPPAVQAWYDALWTSLHGADQPSTSGGTP